MIWASYIISAFIVWLVWNRSWYSGQRKEYPDSLKIGMVIVALIPIANIAILGTLAVALWINGVEFK